MLHIHYQLTPNLMPQLKALEEACIIQDNMGLTLYYQYLVNKRESPFWVYENDKGEWLAFITAFYFYDDACEIILLVHPKVRHQGLSKALLRALLKTMPQANIKTLYFPCPKTFKGQFLLNKGFEYQKSEFRLSFNHTHDAITMNPAICNADLHHLELLYALEKACFNEAQSLARFIDLLKDRHYHLWVYEKEGEILGKVHLREDDNLLTLSNLAVFPKAQGQGIGRALVKHCQAYALQIQKPLSLDVETQNENALHLYLDLGFKLDSATDYYLISLDALKAYCEGKNHKT